MTDKEKEALEQGRQAAREVLYTCLDWSFRLMHPLLPYLTEELYQRLPPSPTKCESIVIAPYPLAVHAWFNDSVEKDMEIVSEVAAKLRSQKQSLGLTPKQKPKACVKHADQDARERLAKLAKPLGVMGMCGDVTVMTMEGAAPPNSVRDVVNDKCLIFMSAEGVDLTQELAKLQKKVESAKKMVQSYEAKMSIPNYEEKVPPQVRQQNTEKLEAAQTEFKELERSVAAIKASMS